MVNKKLLNPVENWREKLKAQFDKSFLTQWKIEEKNRKINGGVPLIDKKLCGNLLLIDKKFGGDQLLIDKELANLKNDVKCVFFPKLTKLLKKLFNLTRTGKKKHHCPISYSLACFVEPVR